MKHIDFEFNNTTYALSVTAEALFTVYDKFCGSDDLACGYRCRNGRRTLESCARRINKLKYI